MVVIAVVGSPTVYSKNYIWWKDLTRHLYVYSYKRITALLIDAEYRTHVHLQVSMSSKLIIYQCQSFCTFSQRQRNSLVHSVTWSLAHSMALWKRRRCSWQSWLSCCSFISCWFDSSAPLLVEHSFFDTTNGYRWAMGQLVLTFAVQTMTDQMWPPFPLTSFLIRASFHWFLGVSSWIWTMSPTQTVCSFVPAVW